LLQGGNEYVIDLITKERNYFTWQKMFLCVQYDRLSDALRAKFCDLMIRTLTLLRYIRFTIVYLSAFERNVGIDAKS